MNYILFLQTNINAENGITLNIGTLASLAPIGPIRLAPTTVNQSATTPSKTSNTTKAATATVKVPKIISNVPLQNVSKMKTIVSSNKSYSNVMSNNYRQINVADKSGDAKLVNVFTTGNQIRVNTATGGKIYVIIRLSYRYVYRRLTENTYILCSRLNSGK